METKRVNKVHLGKAPCALDLGDGSERGEYVNQDYILRKLGRPHRSISLMYCYYPLDVGWPGRASVVHANPDVSYAWDYPYDDYFPYEGGIGGNPEGEPFRQMREIRAHGQDITLTLTMDPRLPDEYLAQIGEDLRPFGRMLLRINHEATGTWFSFNRRCSYQEVADFFVRASRIIKEHAPNVSTIICIGGIENPQSTEMEQEAAFAQTLVAADVWSVDKYMALNWGWPYELAEQDTPRHQRTKVEDIYDLTKRSFDRFCTLNGGVAKPMIMSEFNADGDVTGPFDQAKMVEDFCALLKRENATWFSGFAFYQFRDRGRLGLETEDPNNPEVGVEQPVLQTYKKILQDPWFSPVLTTQEEASLPLTLRWGGAEDADGVEMPLSFEKQPHFCELNFEGDENLMLEFGGMWFYKAPKTRFVDLMPYFYEHTLEGACEIPLRIFAPPANGMNDLTAPDGLLQSYTTLTQLPKARIRFAPIIL